MGISWLDYVWVDTLKFMNGSHKKIIACKKAMFWGFSRIMAQHFL